jgi:uncharacterized membrane protein YeaQ/YmgE (transglycosylase-associated protein family)
MCGFAPLHAAAGGKHGPMNLLFFVLLAIVLLFFDGAIFGAVWSVLWYATVGLIIGAFARVLVRRTGGMGVLLTIACGIAGGLGGGLVGNLLDLGFFAEFLASILVAAVVIVLATSAGNESGRAR